MSPMHEVDRADGPGYESVNLPQVPAFPQRGSGGGLGFIIGFRVYL